MGRGLTEQQMFEELMAIFVKHLDRFGPFELEDRVKILEDAQVDVMMWLRKEH